MSQNSHQRAPEPATLDALRRVSADLQKAKRSERAADLQLLAEALGWRWEEVSWVAGPRPNWLDPAHAARAASNIGAAVSSAASRLSQQRLWVGELLGRAYPITLEEAAEFSGLAVTTLKARLKRTGKVARLVRPLDDVEMVVTANPVKMPVQLTEAQLAEVRAALTTDTRRNAHGRPTRY